MNRLFVYGIFLGERLRQSYGMSDPQYATVKDFTTVGTGMGIVQAVYRPEQNLELTGLVVDVEPSKWDSIDKLEGGYARVKVRTTDNELVYMYTAK